jgi:hypothetical protein
VKRNAGNYQIKYHPVQLDLSASHHRIAADEEVQDKPDEAFTGR